MKHAAQPEPESDRKAPLPEGAATAPGPGSTLTFPLEPSTVGASTGQHARTPPLPTAGTVTARAVHDFGDYQLIEKIDEGGMGVIYRARHVKALREVALKTMRAEVALSADQFARFEREIRAQAALTHPNIVTIYDICLDASRPYFTMELARGGSLARRRAEFRDTRKAVALVEKVARAVHHAHEHGIVHRDLKPGNILLDEDGEPLVGDFGLAKDVRSDVELTRTGLAPGTVPYMAPEQAAGKKDVGAPTDVWALGIILYELLAGTRPFAGDSNDQLRHYILHSEPPSLRKARPGVDRALEAIVLKCLQKDPTGRFRTAGELAEHLARWSSGDPLPIQRERLARRTWRALRRHRRTLASGVAVFLGLAVLAAVWYLKDPEQRLRSLQRSLSRGQAVTLIGAQGRPAWAQWHGSEGVMASARPSLGSAFAISSGKRSLLELLPDPGADSFEVKAEISHVGGGSVDDEVGIYFGRLQRPSQEVFWTVTFNDMESRQQWHPQLPNDSIARLRYGVLGKGEEEDNLSTRVYAETLFNPTLKPGKAWRQIRVQAEPERLRVFWENQLLATLDRRSVASQYQAFLPFLKHADEMPGYPGFRGGIGLYVSHGEAAYRNVAVGPLSQSQN